MVRRMLAEAAQAQRRCRRQGRHTALLPCRVWRWCIEGGIVCCCKWQCGVVQCRVSPCAVADGSNHG